MTPKERGDLPVLVLGGTGHYGRHIVRCLLEKDQPVRVLSRNVARARGVLGDGAEIVEGDITSEASVVGALRGVDRLVISVSAFSPQLIRQMRQIERDAVLSVLDQAQRASVFRVVYLSIYDIREDAARGSEVATIKQEIETTLACSGFNWTVLGPCPSMEMPFFFIRGRTMVVPGGGPPALPTVSPLDVGEIAAQAVLRDDLGGQRMRLVGPAAISFREAARRISAATGKPIGFRKVPLLPLRIAAILTRPFNPFLHHLVPILRLLNDPPVDLVAQAEADRRRLVETFSYTPTTIEMEARRWMQETSRSPQDVAT